MATGLKPYNLLHSNIYDKSETNEILFHGIVKYKRIISLSIYLFIYLLKINRTRIKLVNTLIIAEIKIFK